MVRFLSVLLPALAASSAAFAGAIVVPPVNVPEPASLAVLAIGAGAAVVYRRFRK